MKDLKLDFESYWIGITGGDDQFADRKQAAENEWNNHPEKHLPIMRWIQKHGAYHGRNPFFFIQDFKIRHTIPKGQPTNYRGKAAPHESIFSAKYNGEWGMYTQADIDAYHMEVYKE